MEDRCKRIADRRYDKPSAYKSGAIVRCRKGDIWKDLKEETLNIKVNEKINQLPKGKIFDDAKNIEGIFKKSNHTWSETIEAYEKNQNQSSPSTIDIKDITITQPNIQANKVKNILNKVNDLPPINVIEFEDGEKVIYDGHHRLVADWALGNNTIEVNLIKVKSPKDKIKEIIQELLQEDESLHKWFQRQGPKGKEGGWVDCNAPDGKGGYKACGRKEGESRSKYPACRPTPAGCKRKGKGKTWGKTKENMIKLKDLLSELDSDKIFHIEGVLIIDHNKRNQKRHIIRC